MKKMVFAIALALLWSCAANAQINIVPNPSLEKTDDFHSLPLHWNHGSWGANSPLFTYGTGHTGFRSADVTIKSYASGDAKWYFDPIKVTPGESYMISDWYKSTVPTRVVAVFDNGKKTGNMRYSELRIAPKSNDWTNYSEIIQIPYDAKTMTVYHLLATVGTLSIDDFSATETTSQGFVRPIISLTFDDNWKDNLKTAIPILASYGYKSTYYLSTAFLAKDGINGSIAVKAISAAGHEIGSHSVTHPYITRVTPEELTRELGDSKIYLENLVGIDNVSSFASPYGDYNETALNVIGTYYSSHRTVDEGYNLKNNYDTSRIKVQNMKNTTTMAEFQNWLEQTKKDKSWLVIVYNRVAGHDLQEYDTSTDNFKNQMDAIATSEITVLPISKAIGETSKQLSKLPEGDIGKT